MLSPQTKTIGLVALTCNPLLLCLWVGIGMVMCGANHVTGGLRDMVLYVVEPMWTVRIR